MKKGKHNDAQDRPLLIWPDVSSGMLAADPFGSYTGLPDEPMEKPVQDADDL